MNYFHLPLASTFCCILILTIVHSVVHGQSPACGITLTSGGNIIPPEEFDWPYTVPDHYEANTVLLKVFLKNVNETFVVSHPHVKYLKAQRYPSSQRYEILTTPSYSSFLQEQYPETEIIRASKFNCLDSTQELIYTFRIPVFVSDLHVPKFHTGEAPFSFQITEDWDPSVDINQGQFIIVGDADEAFVNANLTFSLFPEKPLVAVGVPLWPEGGDPPQGHYYYRIDLFYRPASEEEKLTEGVHEFSLMAASRMHSTDTKIVITVKAAEEGFLPNY